MKYLKLHRNLNLIIVAITFLSLLNSCNSKPEANNKETEQSQNKANSNDNISNSRFNAITSAVKKCTPAIVGINVTEIKQVIYRDPFAMDPFFQQFFGQDRSRQRVQKYEVKELGSGFIISPDGYILTNHHVAGNASKVVISMTDGTEKEAKIIGSDAVSDVTLLKIEGENLPHLELANSDEVVPGEWAIAFGNPFGLFDRNSRPTVTVGVVSNIGVSFLHNENNVLRVYKNMIQTDAAISSGNSGGPLINSLGEVIGMNTVIFSTANDSRGSGSIGIGYAIPINRVRSMMQKIKNGEKLERNVYHGMDVIEIDDDLANNYKLKVKRGLIVRNLNRNSPADQAGIEPGDIITEIDGTKVTKLDDFQIYINDAVVGQKINFKILHDDKEVNKILTLKNARVR